VHLGRERRRGAHARRPGPHKQVNERLWKTSEASQASNQSPCVCTTCNQCTGGYPSACVVRHRSIQLTTGRGERSKTSASVVREPILSSSSVRSCPAAVCLDWFVLSCLVSLECILWEGFFWRMPKQAYTVPCRASHPRGQGAQVLCT